MLNTLFKVVTVAYLGNELRKDKDAQAVAKKAQKKIKKAAIAAWNAIVED